MPRPRVSRLSEVHRGLGADRAGGGACTGARCGPVEPVTREASFLRGASVGSVRMMSGFICFLFSIPPVPRGAPSRATGRGSTPLLTPD